MAINKYYFTFGQIHVRSVNGKTFDKDCVVEIEAKSENQARDIMFDTFDTKWFTSHDEIPDMSYFPRGIMTIEGAKE